MNGSAGELLENLRARGFHLRADGPDLVVLPPQRGALTPELVGELREAKPALLAFLRTAPASPTSSPASSPEALAWRVAAMRQQVRPGESVPLLLAIPGRTPEQWDEAGCLSCGGPLDGTGYRCGACVEAVHIAVREFREIGREPYGARDSGAATRMTGLDCRGAALNLHPTGEPSGVPAEARS